MKSDGRNDVLKLIAIFTMLIDHSGVLLFPDYDILRTIGRISFPIFCYFIANGYRYTSNRRNYFNRILIFAFISQIPYMFLNYGAEFKPFQFNVLFLFAYSLIVLHFIDRFRDRKTMAFIITAILIIIPIIPEIFLKDFAFSYNYYGILLVVIFYIFKDNPKKIFFSFIILSLVHPYISAIIYRAHKVGITSAIVDYQGTLNLLKKYSSITHLSGFLYQARSIMGVMTIFIFSNLKTNFRINKYFFYAFYPAHITILLMIRYFMEIQ